MYLTCLNKCLTGFMLQCYTCLSPLWGKIYSHLIFVNCPPGPPGLCNDKRPWAPHTTAGHLLSCLLSLHILQPYRFHFCTFVGHTVHEWIKYGLFVFYLKVMPSLFFFLIVTKALQMYNIETTLNRPLSIGRYWHLQFLYFTLWFCLSWYVTILYKTIGWLILNNLPYTCF